MVWFCYKFCKIRKCKAVLNVTLRSSFSLDHRPPSYLHIIGKEPLVYRTIGQQIGLARERYGDRDAIVSCVENKRYTFSEAIDRADRLAGGFVKLGLNIGDRIGIWAPSSTNWYITMLATARAGLVLVPLNTAYTIQEMVYCLKTINLRVVVTTDSHKTQNFYKTLTKITAELKTTNGELNIPKIIIESEKTLPETHNLEDVLTLASKSEVKTIENLSNKTDPDAPYLIQFTSGTTGNPKAVQITHFSLINNCILLGKRLELNTKAHRICLQNPLYHGIGVALGIIPSIIYGSTLVLPSTRFNAAESLQAIINERCTVIYGTPTMYVDMVCHLKKQNLTIKSAEIAMTGGASCSPKLFTDIKNILGLKKIKSVYGMTETIITFASLFEESEYHVTETVGHVMDHVEVKVINEIGEIVPMGTPGELCVRGYSTMLGYLNNDIETNKTIGKDMWLKTGDQFILREDRYGQIVGRYKDIIIRGGVNIYSKEIEDIINSHPDVIETHVFGIPDDRLGEEVCAYIRTNEKGKTLDQKEIKEFCKENLAYFKIPRYVKVVENFPNTSGGKIQKFKLTEQFINGH